MIRLKLAINDDTTLMDIVATRVYPVHVEPVEGDICNYTIDINGKDAGQLVCPYGDAIHLAKMMFDHYEDYKE